MNTYRIVHQGTVLWRGTCSFPTARMVWKGYGRGRLEVREPGPWAVVEEEQS